MASFPFSRCRSVIFLQRWIAESIAYAMAFIVLLESKSLQTNSIKRTLNAGVFSATATYQCDASDCRKITLRNGRVVTTTCLEVGEFEIVAVNLFAIDDTWRFAFALNNDLPRTKSKKYAKRVRPFLLATLPKITWPQHYPYVSDPFVLMNLLLAGQKSLPKPVLTS